MSNLPAPKDTEIGDKLALHLFQRKTVPEMTLKGKGAIKKIVSVQYGQLFSVPLGVAYSDAHWIILINMCLLHDPYSIS